MHSRKALLGYFAFAFWVSWAGVMLTAGQTSAAPVFVAMLLGPSLASVGLTGALEGIRGVRILAQRVFDFRVAARWYAALLVAPVLVSFVLFGMASFSSSFLPAIIFSPRPAFVLGSSVLVGLCVGFFEELGWTGFATPRLLERHSWLHAGILLGIPWALWHMLPDYVHEIDRYGALWEVHILEWVVALVAYRVFMTWVYSRTRSLPLGMLLHASFTGGQLLLWPTTLVRAELVWYGFFALGLWIVVSVVVRDVAASPDERRRAMPGDRIVPEPFFTATHAITIETPPERVWPWLSQMGAMRAGWYSYDRIDNGGQPSAEHVIERFQHVTPGDVLPATPGAKAAFVVASADPPRDLVLTVPGKRGAVVTWEHLIQPLERARSRLIVRGRVSREWKKMAREAGPAGVRPIFIERVYHLLGRLPDPWMRAIASAGHRWMEARHIRGIKRRAEATAGSFS